MHEISSNFMLLWTIGTFLFASGFGWAGIKFGQRQTAESVKEVKRMVREIRGEVDALKDRLTGDERDYVTKTECRDEQDECAKHRDYHENRLLTKIVELKDFMIQMDSKRENTRIEMTEALRTLAADLRAENDRRMGAISK